MNQQPLFLEDRTRYLVKVKNKTGKAWFMGGVWCFDNYAVESNVEVLERIGNEKELFG